MGSVFDATIFMGILFHHFTIFISLVLVTNYILGSRFRSTSHASLSFSGQCAPLGAGVLDHSMSHALHFTLIFQKINQEISYLQY